MTEHGLADFGDAGDLPESVQGLIAARLDGRRPTRSVAPGRGRTGQGLLVGGAADDEDDGRDPDALLHSLERKEFVRRERRSVRRGRSGVRVQAPCSSATSPIPRSRGPAAPTSTAPRRRGFARSGGQRITSTSSPIISSPRSSLGRRRRRTNVGSGRRGVALARRASGRSVSMRSPQRRASSSRRSPLAGRGRGASRPLALVRAGSGTAGRDWRRVLAEASAGLLALGDGSARPRPRCCAERSSGCDADSKAAFARSRPRRRARPRRSAVGREGPRPERCEGVPGSDPRLEFQRRSISARGARDCEPAPGLDTCGLRPASRSTRRASSPVTTTASRRSRTASPSQRQSKCSGGQRGVRARSRDGQPERLFWVQGGPRAEEQTYEYGSPGTIRRVPLRCFAKLESAESCSARESSWACGTIRSRHQRVSRPVEDRTESTSGGCSGAAEDPVRALGSPSGQRKSQPRHSSWPAGWQIHRSWRSRRLRSPARHTSCVIPATRSAHGARSTS